MNPKTAEKIIERADAPTIQYCGLIAKRAPEQMTFFSHLVICNDVVIVAMAWECYEKEHAATAYDSGACTLEQYEAAVDLLNRVDWVLIAEVMVEEYRRLYVETYGAGKAAQPEDTHAVEDKEREPIDTSELEWSNMFGGNGGVFGNGGSRGDN